MNKTMQNAKQRIEDEVKEALADLEIEAKKQKLTLAYLTGKVPLELQGEELPPPSDFEIKALLVNMPAADVRKIHRGPYGERFKKLCQEAIDRLDVSPKPSYGRSASVFLEFGDKQVSPQGHTVNPEKE